MDGVRQKSKHEACPLKLWNKVVRRTTRMTIGDELRPAYIEMCTIINEVELKGHLEGYPDLFLLKNEMPGSGQNRTQAQAHKSVQKEYYV